VSPIRVYLEGLRAGRRQLPTEAAHYLARVQRLAAGDRFVAFDPEAVLEADATLLHVSRQGSECELAVPRAARRAELGVTLMQAAGKGDKLEEVVRAATALGAAEVRVVVSERSVARPGSERGARLRAVAVAAARQSGRGDVPRITGPLSLLDALGELSGLTQALRICLHPRAALPLADAIAGSAAGGEALLLIGPEGGFSDAELASIEQSGFCLAALGPLTLRTELAAIAALGAFAARLPGAPDRL